MRQMLNIRTEKPKLNINVKFCLYTNPDKVLTGIYEVNSQGLGFYHLNEMYNKKYYKAEEVMSWVNCYV